LCVQVLLLRDHGYTAERGEVFDAETRQRVSMHITPPLVEQTFRVVADAPTRPVTRPLPVPWRA